MLRKLILVHDLVSCDLRSCCSRAGQGAVSFA